MLAITAVLVATMASSVVPPHHAAPPRHRAATPPIVTIRTTEYAFAAPASIAAGASTFRMVNAGKQLHHVTIVRLAPGKTMADYVNAMKKPGPPPAWSTMVGGPNAAAPGQSSESTITLDAGNYLLICLIPSPGEEMPHAMKGMVRPLTVTPSHAPSAEPIADVRLTLTDYAFTMSKPLTAGHHVLHVTNAATQAHEFLLVKLAPGKSAKDVFDWVEAGMKGAPPAMPLGGGTPMDAGRTLVVPVDLVPGSYGLICFVPDAKDGKPHGVHGMTQTFVVK
jgi:uncharacterized cupredoxin-like copper-binding protein